MALFNDQRTPSGVLSTSFSPPEFFGWNFFRHLGEKIWHFFGWPPFHKFLFKETESHLSIFFSLSLQFKADKLLALKGGFGRFSALGYINLDLRSLWSWAIPLAALNAFFVMMIDLDHCWARIGLIFVILYLLPPNLSLNLIPDCLSRGCYTR